MQRFVKKNKGYLRAFVIAWSAVILVQFVVLYFIYGIEFYAAAADALVFNLLFALAGYMLWFVVRYNLKEKTSFIDLFTQHFFAAVIIVGSWFFVSQYILLQIFSDDQDYTVFLTESVPLRIITGVFYYVMYVLIYYLIIYYEDLQERLQREAEWQKLVKEAELAALKSQINPHFLFNSLNSISSLTITEPDKAREMVIRLSDFLRYSLSGGENAMTTFEKEFENVKRYLEIEKVRFGNRLEFVHQVDENCKRTMLPSLILQPLVENAIKHGVYHSSETVKILLECTQAGDFTLIKIVNDFDPDAVVKKGEGIGLKNIKSRLKLTYQRQDLLKIEKGERVFTALLKIPQEY